MWHCRLSLVDYGKAASFCIRSLCTKGVCRARAASSGSCTPRTFASGVSVHVFVTVLQEPLIHFGLLDLPGVGNHSLHSMARSCCATGPVSVSQQSLR